MYSRRLKIGDCIRNKIRDGKKFGQIVQDVYPTFVYLYKCLVFLRCFRSNEALNVFCAKVTKTIQDQSVVTLNVVRHLSSNIFIYS